MRGLHYFNLIGVLALAALCLAQWQRNRELNLEVNRLKKGAFDQTAKLSGQEKTARGLKDDLAQLTAQFSNTTADLSDARQKLRMAERDISQLVAERNQLKSSVTNWAAAVSARDERLKDANAQLRKRADELNASIRKFNELASNYNVVVKDLNDLRTRPLQPSGPARPETARPQ